MTTGDPLRDALLTQVDWWWAAIFRPRIEGVTDEELWWQPAPDCWTLHRGDDGGFRYEWPPGSRGETTPPFTTLAWRLCHLVFPAMANWTLALEGRGETAADLTFPERGAEAVALLDEWWSRWRAVVGALTDAQLWQPLSRTALGVDAPLMRLGAQDPLLHHLLHQHREFIHHGSEISLLRDLYRARG